VAETFEIGIARGWGLAQSEPITAEDSQPERQTGNGLTPPECLEVVEREGLEPSTRHYERWLAQGKLQIQ
jgi:hypothetical protein